MKTHVMVLDPMQPEYTLEDRLHFMMEMEGERGIIEDPISVYYGIWPPGVVAQEEQQRKDNLSSWPATLFSIELTTD